MQEANTLEVTGGLEELRAVRELLLDGEDGFIIGDPTTKEDDLFGRRPSGQIETFTIVVHFLASLGAHATYEIIKKATEGLKEKGKGLDVQKPKDD